MKRGIGCLVVLFWLAFAEYSFACSFVAGYFYQVTTLKGRVVGANLHSWGPFQPQQKMRSLRQSVSRSGAKLTLYEYRAPIKARSDLVEVAQRTADKKGYFDFGELKQGHYSLVIDVDKEWSAWFDVQVTKNARRTKRITIDVSPVYPDCKGGHEFLVETES